jgi:hypothetical protein
MIRLKNYHLSFSVIALVLLSGWMHAEVYYKEVRKSIPVNSDAKLELDVNFADVHIETTNQSQMEIVVKMDVTARDEKRADEMFDNFQVNISESRELVVLSVGTGSWSCNSKGKNSESYTVHVEVKMPLKAVLDGKCAFGDLRIGDMQGACLVNVEYGEMHVNGLWSYENDLKIAFGNAYITGTNGGNFENEYGSLDITLLQGNAEIESSFGDLEIRRVAKECKDLEVKIQYADADIHLALDAGFRFEANSSYGDIDLPSQAKKTFSESDYTNKQMKGTIGNGEGKLDVECDFGDIEIDVIPK